MYYYLAVLVLAGSAAAMQIVDFQVIKKPLPLRKPLIDFDKNALKPLIKTDARILSKDIVEELGTEEYLEWTLVDPRVADSSQKRVEFFLTFYTNVQDQVPHVPEECRRQSGNSSKSNDDTLSWSLDALDGEEVAVRRLGFVAMGQLETKTIVYYTLVVNGQFYAGRRGARLKMSSFDETHLYYSKIEIAFDEVTDDDIPQLDERVRELLDLTVAEMFDAHWPPRGTEKGGYQALIVKSANQQRSTNN